MSQYKSYVIVEINWKEYDHYNGYSERRQILAVSDSLEKAKRFIEETAEVDGYSYKWSDEYNYSYYENGENNGVTYGTRFTIKTTINL